MHTSPPLPITDKKTRAVITKMGKKLGGSRCECTLAHVIVVLDLDGDEQLYSKNRKLNAVRRYRVDDMNGKDDVGQVFRTELGTGYGNEVVQRVATLPELACYLVEDEAGTVIGAFCVLLFDCILSDGTPSLALMVDTFAVRRKCQGKGYGRLIFYDMVLPFAHRRLTAREGSTRFVVFAQCVVARPGSDYWYDKLDDSSEARSLLLQACTRFPEHVNVQGGDCCTPRLAGLQPRPYSGVGNCCNFGLSGKMTV